MNELDVFTLIKKKEDEKINFPWKEYFESAYKTAEDCVFILTTIAEIRKYRKEEKEKGLKRTPNIKLTAKIQQEIKNGEKRAIISFIPLQDDWLDDWLTKIIEYGPPHNIENEKDIEDSIDCARVTQCVFHTLLNNNSTDSYPNKIILLLIQSLCYMLHSISELVNKFNAEERLGDQNSCNASLWTPTKIEKYKQHEKYPRLEYLTRSCKNTPKEIRTINSLVETIIRDIDKKNGLKISKVTIRRYRKLFFQEIQK